MIIDNHILSKILTDLAFADRPRIFAWLGNIFKFGLVHFLVDTYGIVYVREQLHI